MILVRNIRLPLSAGEPQAFEKALHAARIPRGKVGVYCGCHPERTCRGSGFCSPLW